jgi:hypothetical protein
MLRGVTLFTYDIKRSLSSHSMWGGVTLQNIFGEKPLFTYDVESLFTFGVERSHTSH